MSEKKKKRFNITWMRNKYEDQEKKNCSKNKDDIKY